MTDILRILAGPLAWLMAFSAVYGLHGLICGHQIDGAVPGLPLPRLLMVAAFLVSTTVLAGVVWVLHAPRFASTSPFVTFVSRTTGWVGLLATAWTLWPTVITTYCH